MSSQQTPITEGSVRVAIGELLRSEEWQADNALGYDPSLSEGDANHLDVTLGTYSEDNPVPQLALRDVSVIAEGGAGYSAIKATGEGPIQTFMGRIDVLTYVGEQGELTDSAGGELNAQLAAKRIGHEVRAIVHDNSVGIMDPATGELLATSLACSRPRVTPDPDLPGPHWVGRQEVTYEVNEDPPNR